MSHFLPFANLLGLLLALVGLGFWIRRLSIRRGLIVRERRRHRRPNGWSRI